MQKWHLVCFQSFLTATKCWCNVLTELIASTDTIYGCIMNFNSHLVCLWLLCWFLLGLCGRWPYCTVQHVVPGSCPLTMWCLPSRLKKATVQQILGFWHMLVYWRLINWLVQKKHWLNVRIRTFAFSCVLGSTKNSTCHGRFALWTAFL